MRFLSKLYSKLSNRNTEQPVPPSTDASGIEFLRTATLRAISVNANSEFGENDGSGEAMQAYLDRNAQETNDSTSHSLFHFEFDGAQIYPVFTSASSLSAWLRKNPLETEFICAVTSLIFEGSKLFRHFKGAPPSVIVVLDYRSDSERVLSHEELQALAGS